MKRVPMRRASSPFLRRKPMRKRPARWTDPTARAAVIARARGRCEVGVAGCSGKIEHVHHRLRRSQGGTDDPDLMLAVCLRCHGHIHANPAESYDRGWLIRSGS